jgi:hypothetical protein
MISWSKSGYLESNRDNLVCFNANIFTLEDGKIWYGDLDITKEQEKLEQVSAELGKPLYILREMDGRFENEELPQKQIIERAIAVIK